MSAVMSCPRCAARVSMPESAASESWVRCPVCSGEYRLQEAMDYVPPSLVLIERPEGEAARDASWMAAPSMFDEKLPAEAATSTTAADVSVGAEEEAIHFDESLLLDEPGSGIDFESADTSGSGAMIGSSKSAVGGSEEFFDQFVGNESPMAEGERKDEAFDVSESVDEDDFRLAPREETPPFATADDVSHAAAAVATMPRREARKSHPLLMLVGIVGGGLSGIVLGYAILMWAFGKDPAGVAKSLPNFLVPSSLERTPIAQGNQPAQNNPGVPNSTFPEFGSGDTSSESESATPAATNDTQDKTTASDPFAATGADAAKSDAADLLTTTAPADDVAKSDVGKSEPFGGLDDPLMQKSDPFGTVDDPLAKKADDGQSGDSAHAADPFGELTKSSIPTKSDISDPFGDPAPSTADEAKADLDSGDAKVEPAASDESKADETKTEAPESNRAVTTSRYPIDIGPVGPQFERLASEADLAKAIEAAKETTAAAMAVSADAPQAEKNRANGPHFLNLTKVADAITTLDVPPQAAAAAGSGTKARKEAEALVLDAVPSVVKFDELGKLSGYFYSSSAAKAGIVIAGTVKEVKQSGEVFQSVIETPGNHVAITVLSPMKLAEEGEQRVIVLGRIVDDPSSIRGYVGSAARAVWSVFAVEPRASESR